MSENKLVVIDTDMGKLEMKREQISKLLKDVSFLEDAMLVLLNPDYCKDCWDIPFSYNEVLIKLKEYLLNSQYAKEFIEELLATSNYYQNEKEKNVKQV